MTSTPPRYPADTLTMTRQFPFKPKFSTISRQIGKSTRSHQTWTWTWISTSRREWEAKGKIKDENHLHHLFIWRCRHHFARPFYDYFLNFFFHSQNVMETSARANFRFESFADSQSTCQPVSHSARSMSSEKAPVVFRYCVYGCVGRCLSLFHLSISLSLSSLCTCLYARESERHTELW